jgi:hypothetical protein
LKRVRLRSLAVLDDKQGRQAVPVSHVERAGKQIDALEGVRVEGARQSDHRQIFGRNDEPERVVNLDAVHDRQVLIGAAATHRDPAAELVGAGHTGERLQRAKDILEPARESPGLEWTDRPRRRTADGCP